MRRKPVIIIAVVSLAVLVIGYLWKTSDPESDNAILLYFFGWIASLLTVGYVSTPTGSMKGKVAFAFVCVIVAGIVMKVLHYLGANELIIGGLLGLAITYVVGWATMKKA